MPEPTEVIILGTIHSGHFENESYSPERVKHILLALKPAAICVELYSKFFNDDGTLVFRSFRSARLPSSPKTKKETAGV